jgi:hypothetical protein
VSSCATWTPRRATTARASASAASCASDDAFDNALYRGERITYSAEFGFQDLENTTIELIQPIAAIVSLPRRV